MSIQIPGACAAVSVPVSPLVRDHRLAESVQSVLLGCRGASPRAEALRLDRRRNRRFPYPKPIRLIPVDGGGRVDATESLVVIGRYLSEQGLDFYSTVPISHRRMVAEFDCGSERAVSILLDLAWCRFTQKGWYENGGRLLQVLDGLP